MTRKSYEFKPVVADKAASVGGTVRANCPGLKPVRNLCPG